MASCGDRSGDLDREESLPKITSLAEEGRFCAAFALANQAESLLGKGDIKLAALQREIARTAGLDTEPSGAEVFYSDLRSSEKEWRSLGKTPLTAVSIPRGYFRLRFEKQGFETTYGLFGAVTDYRKYSLFPKTEIPPGMVAVPPVSPVLPRRFSDDRTSSPASRSLIDRYEVTNRQFKEFVEAGGYRGQKFWKQPFVHGAKTMVWAEAMTVFQTPPGVRALRHGRQETLPPATRNFP